MPKTDKISLEKYAVCLALPLTQFSPAVCWPTLEKYTYECKNHILDVWRIVDVLENV